MRSGSKGSRSREQEQREQEQREQEQGAGAKGAGAKGAGAKGAGAKSRSREHKHEEWGAQGARCAHAIGACTMLVAVCSAVEQALHQEISRTRLPLDQSLGRWKR